MTALVRTLAVVAVAVAAVSVPSAAAAEPKRLTVAFLDLSLKLNAPPTPLSADRASAAAAELSAVNADIILVSGLASENDSATLQGALGGEYVFTKSAAGPTPNGRVAIISKIKPETCEIVAGKKYNVKKNTPIPVGNDFIHAVFNLDGYRLHIIAGLLKDRAKHPLYGQTNMRRYEARELRKLATAILKKKIDANILVIGNMNDTCGKSPLKELYSRRSKPARRLYDLRPVDHINVAWTAVDETTDEYERIDYVLASSGIVPETLKDSLKILHKGNWRSASAHRVVSVSIACRDAALWSEQRLEKEFPYSIRYADAAPNKGKNAE